MTLRRLSDHLSMEAGAEGGSPASNPALVFVLNKDFLPGLRVLCFSLCRHKTLLDLPILVISEQAELFDDPLVAFVADRTRHATAEEIQSFRGISAEIVEPKLKLDWIAKYTYLKWLLFDDYGFDRHVFIDADIVCLAPVDELLDLSGADLFGGPVFAKSLHSNSDGRMDAAAVDEAITAFALNPKPSGRRLNTGVLVVNKRLLSKQFRTDLIAFAEAGSFSVEQAALRNYIGARKELKLRLISPLYNFNQSYLERVSADKRATLLDGIKLLHFAGAGAKPWAKPATQSVADAIWRRYAGEAADFPILRGLA